MHLTMLIAHPYMMLIIWSKMAQVSLSLLYIDTGGAPPGHCCQLPLQLRERCSQSLRLLDCHGWHRRQHHQHRCYFGSLGCKHFQGNCQLLLPSLSASCIRSTGDSQNPSPAPPPHQLDQRVRLPDHHLLPQEGRQDNARLCELQLWSSECPPPQRCCCDCVFLLQCFQRI